VSKLRDLDKKLPAVVRVEFDRRNPMFIEAELMDDGRERGAGASRMGVYGRGIEGIGEGEG
jgi:hypothetical protein